MTGARQKTRGAHKRQRAGIIMCQGCMHDNTKRDSPSSSVSTDPPTRFSRSVPASLSRSAAQGWSPVGAAQGWSPVGAAQVPSRDHRRFHNAALTRSAINESVETVREEKYVGDQSLWSPG